MRVLLVAALLLGVIGAWTDDGAAERPCGPNVQRCEPPEFLCHGWPPTDPVARAQWLASCVDERVWIGPVLP